MSGSDHFGNPLEEDVIHADMCQGAPGNFFEDQIEARSRAEARRQVSCWQAVLAWMLQPQTCIDE